MNRKRILFLVGAALALLFGAAAYLAASTWGDVQRVSIDRPQAASEDGGPGQEDLEPGDPSYSDGEITVPPSGDGLDVAILVGSDSRQSLDDTEGFGDFEGQRADVIMVMIRDRSTQKAGIMSIPRDLWVDSVCEDEGQWRINETLEGCGSRNGPSVLVQTVEELIGVPVDHFAMVDLAGFQDAVDAVGGYEICVENPVRDSRADLQLPAGCTDADGEQTLAWLRSRHTQELTDDGWQTMEGVSDLVRNERQREFLIAMMGQIADFSNPQDIIGIAQAVAPFVTVDDNLSMMDAVGLATTFRGFDDDSLVEIELPVTDYVADSGAAVLVVTADPEQLVDEFLSPTTAESDLGDAG
ncbi:MAG: LytR family transcriptional regulator [Actinobacteria bacterium]|nr:MAG: LytR family transcriptional regulator [Actinomycetota bacterium]REK37173.1 MAG: LytR family transcriptional regulator [Actinomycetota bacterium]